MLKKWLKRDVSKQFIRFCLIGLESTILTYLVFIILFYFLQTNYTVSFIAGFVSGIFFGFIFNKKWTFKSEREFEKEIFIYLGVYFVSLGVGTLMIRFLVSYFFLNPLIANLPTIFVTTLINFIGTKVLAFRNKRW